MPVVSAAVSKGPVSNTRLRGGLNIWKKISPSWSFSSLFWSMFWTYLCKGILKWLLDSFWKRTDRCLRTYFVAHKPLPCWETTGENDLTGAQFENRWRWARPSSLLSLILCQCLSCMKLKKAFLVSAWFSGWDSLHSPARDEGPTTHREPRGSWPVRPFPSVHCS